MKLIILYNCNKIKKQYKLSLKKNNECKTEISIFNFRKLNCFRVNFTETISLLLDCYSNK